MSERLPSREQALELLQQNHCPPIVISHCVAVADLALETARKIENNGFKVDTKIVEAGALLHDLGRSKTHGVDHAVVGAQIAQELGLPEPIIRIIKRHVGGGITAAEADAFGWPKDVYVPETLEEKIVSYADKLISNSKRMPITVEVRSLISEGKEAAAERVRNLYDEISNLLDATK